MSALADDSGATGLGQARTWIACGVRIVLEQKKLWYLMSADYLVLGFLLTTIPFMGKLLLILVSPMLLASVIWGLARKNSEELPAEPKPISMIRALLQKWITVPSQELLTIFTQKDKVSDAVLLGIITLGLAILVMIPREWFIGGSMLSGLVASSLGVSIVLILKILVVAALYVILAMGLLYSVPLTVLGNRQPLDAISESFTACRAHAKPLLALVTPFFLVYVVILAAFANSLWLGSLLTVSIGLLALPLFIAAVYCSYLTLFPADPSTPRR